MADLIDTHLKNGVLTKASTVEATGKLHIQTFQDIEPNIEQALAMRNDEDYTRKGIKRGFVHLATIPTVVVAELLTIGVNVYNAPAKDIVAGLRKLHKENLLTSTKKLWRG